MPPTPPATDKPLVYEQDGSWSGLYVDDRYDDGMFQVREYDTDRIRSTKLHRPFLDAWLANNGRTCPDLI